MNDKNIIQWTFIGFLIIYGLIICLIGEISMRNSQNKLNAADKEQ